MGKALNTLDDAIQDFITEVDGGTLSGWVLAYQVSEFTDSPDLVPLITATSYAMSAATPGENALGLLHLTGKRIERDILSYDDSATDD